MKRICVLRDIILCWFIFLLVLNPPLCGKNKNHDFSFSAKVKTFTLENGMRFFVYERHHIPSFAGAIMVKAGSVDERENQRGLAHFFEHMAFKGTAFDVTALYSENGGESLNATTTTDSTQYFVKLPANRLELWFALESARFRQPVFKDFHQEKNVILEEECMSIENDPGGCLQVAFHKLAFKRHPYRHPVLGYAEDIRNFDEKGAQEFFNTYYIPNNMAAALVGDIDYLEVKKLATQYFGPLSTGNPPPRIRCKEPLQEQAKKVKIKFDAEPRLLIGWHMPPFPAEDNIVIDLIAGILSGTRSSRLYKDLVTEQELAATVYAFTESPGSRYSSLFTIYAMPRSPHTSEELETAIVEHLEKLKSQPVTQREIDAVINRREAAFYRQTVDNLHIALNILPGVILYDDIDAEVKKLQRMRKVTTADIMSTASRIFIQSNRSTAILTPGADRK